MFAGVDNEDSLRIIVIGAVHILAQIAKIKCHNLSTKMLAQDAQLDGACRSKNNPNIKKRTFEYFDINVLESHPFQVCDSSKEKALIID